MSDSQLIIWDEKGGFEPHILRAGWARPPNLVGRGQPATSSEEAKKIACLRTGRAAQIEPVKRLFFLLLVALSATSARGQYAAFKSADGVLLISQRPGRYFSIDLPGAKIIPVGQKEATHPSFIICDRPNDRVQEGRFVQVMPVPLAEFKGQPQESDETLLRRQAQYETTYWHPRDSDLRLTKLENGRTALLWQLTLARKLRAGSIQLFLSFREPDYVLVLSSNVPNERKIRPTEAYLRRLAASFHAAARPIPTPVPHK